METSAHSPRRWLPILTALLLLAPTASAVVTIEWTTVGSPGNACDTQTQGCFGAVLNEYRISKHEVTNAQYAEFLNAVGSLDTVGLYDTGMGSGSGSIGRSGSNGTYSYTVAPGREDLPVNSISFWNAVRFANWLHNGQPTGEQHVGTTEAGAYTLTQFDIDNNLVIRNSGAEVFIPSEDEWYKAAYYDAGTSSYFDYPAGSDASTTCATPTATMNHSNCGNAVGDLTAVESYTGSASPSGTFDQGGNLQEWTETVVSSLIRVIRGGGFTEGATSQKSSSRDGGFPAFSTDVRGIRLASPVPPPAVPSLSPIGFTALGTLVVLAGTVAVAGASRRGVGG